ncbi:response regulator [Niallia sp. 03133]|uniref:response regulator n=1 Tax=Niallia sp. 03133 TaxID=3458060 RepID=UPI0040446528
MAKILIVDADPYIRELIKMLLTKEGLSILEASDGLSALDFLKSEKVDLIVMDIMMPNMDGWKLCREIRAYYSPTLPILMLTAKGETAQKVVID